VRPLPPGRAETLAGAFTDLQEVPLENIIDRFSLLAGFPVVSVTLD